MNAALVHVMPAAPFRAAQRRHFLFSVALPTLLMLALPLLPAGWLPLFEHGGLAAALLLGMWFLVGGVGVSVGLHRHFSHRAFEATPPLRATLGVLGGMAAQGPATYWVALHRMHHAASDRPGDPHSPQQAAWGHQAGTFGRLRAAWQGHIGWVLGHDVPKPTRYARELLADPLLRRLSRAYPLCVALGLAAPAVAAVAALGWPDTPDTDALASIAQHAAFGVYWGGIVRIALGHHVIWAINSWCHLGGARPHATSDHSANVGALALLSWGESWHNNHHAQPTSARFGAGWRQPDVGWWVVRGLVALGWARLREPARAEGAGSAV